MAFSSFTSQIQIATLLQRSVARGRMAHAYLFAGDDAALLEGVARTLAKLLLCDAPVLDGNGHPDCCDRCTGCRRVDADVHPDVSWVRPESKLRLVRVPQVRELLRVVGLKPTEGRWKVAILSAADRMNDQAANALLKTLEEPPGQSVLLLLSTRPERLLETVVSRCLRLRFSGGGMPGLATTEVGDWLREFASGLQSGAATILRRYQVLGLLLAKLATLRERIEADLQSRATQDSQAEVDGALQEKWAAELAAAVEAEYRRQRGEFLGGLEWFFRDVWMQTLRSEEALLALPDMRETTAALARRFKPAEALANLRGLAQTARLLETNAQEALVLEVGLLRLHL